VSIIRIRISEQIDRERPLLGVPSRSTPKRLALVAERACDTLQAIPDGLRDIRAEQLLGAASY
jgi:hypothetical protein